MTTLFSLRTTFIFLVVLWFFFLGTFTILLLIFFLCFELLSLNFFLAYIFSNVDHNCSRSVVACQGRWVERLGQSAVCCIFTRRPLAAAALYATSCAQNKKQCHAAVAATARRLVNQFSASLAVYWPSCFFWFFFAIRFTHHYFTPHLCYSRVCSWRVGIWLLPRIIIIIITAIEWNETLPATVEATDSSYTTLNTTFFITIAQICANNNDHKVLFTWRHLNASAIDLTKLMMMLPLSQLTSLFANKTVYF